MRKPVVLAFLSIITLFILLIPLCHAQQTAGWMIEQDVAILKSMKLKYTKQDCFVEQVKTECFKQTPKLEAILTCVFYRLQSDDGNFLAFIPVYKIFTKEDSVSLREILPKANLDNIDKMHVNLIKGNINQTLGKEASLSWKKHVTYYSSDDAKAKFNADTAITFPLKLNPSEYYQDKYPYLYTLILQKKGRGYINFYCFYNDTALEKLAVYRKAIENGFRYED